ncbi:MAG: matrixin family metalloprotease [Chloroflexota bacterium]|nr:matrixin family metalloprotease [Chloroflexota bacterium]
MTKRNTALLLLVVLLLLIPLSVSAQAEAGDPDILALMRQINTQLATQGSNLAVEEIELFTIGKERPSNRLLQMPFRWVPNDPRRNADGDNITYLVDQSDGATASGLTSAQTEAAIDRAMTTWDRLTCMKTVDIVKRSDNGADPDFFDALVGFGEFGNPYLADIVNAGWLPRSFFDAATGAPDSVLGFSITFIFVDDATREPTDINGDNYLDTGHNEVYYNDTFGTAGDPRADLPWGIDVALPGIDVETVALHENGHSLGVTHFGPPPDTVMNPVYVGIRQELFPIDHAEMCTVWQWWPQK